MVLPSGRRGDADFGPARIGQVELRGALGRGRSSRRSSLSTVASPDSPPVLFRFKNVFPGFTYQFIQNWKNVAGDGNCGFRVVSNFLFGDENHWVEIRRRMIFDLRHHMLSQSTTALPLVSNMDGRTHRGIAAFHTITINRWMPFAPITCAMRISSIYVSQWMGDPISQSDGRLGYEIQ
ncbi:hypothetical protein M9H77_23043 [Catharanthus roseus]|uniref:Uncharacterized protein n=1 Tax=Catharanthus roseus TaxID=4058 RepID=A0ACC0ATP9_CATRO|nr:hypothetical protein M9H77_23043 [Catharanthus roseus]